MRVLLFLLLLCGAVGAQDDLQYFAPNDRSFVVEVPGPVRSLNQEGGTFLWGSDFPRKSYVFGYSEIPAAATMTREQLIPALGDYLDSMLKSANTPRQGAAKPVDMLGLPAVEMSGVGARGVHRVRAIARGGRVYVLSCEGVKPEEAARYWGSFKLMN